MRLNACASGYQHALVDLVDGRVDRSQLDQLAADGGDEAAVRSAAGGGQLRLDAHDFMDRRLEASTSFPRGVRNGMPDKDHSRLYSNPCLRRTASTRC